MQVLRAKQRRGCGQEEAASMTTGWEMSWSSAWAGRPEKRSYRSRGLKQKEELLQLLKTVPVPATSSILTSCEVSSGSLAYGTFCRLPLFILPPCYHPCPEKLFCQKESKRYRIYPWQPQ